ncbi:uncharacterized protein TNCV_4416411 [Trichonephila clavipes]|uniref:Uncharacterized protein n=1 Tax=Trichonephila clavipes TaxID=2585209 RepID=A0A8X6S1A0_TRICX|nr:uncharacterized protein TNCV_4416411 [Trichonephila clavipes]
MLPFDGQPPQNKAIAILLVEQLNKSSWRWETGRYSTAENIPKIFNGLRSGEYAGHAIRATPSLFSKHDIAQSDTVQLPCSGHHFNRAPYDWTDRGIQTRGTRAYSPFICNLRRTVAADIALPMDAVTIDVTRVEEALRFRLSKIAIHRSSSPGIVPLGDRLRTVWFGIVSINVKLQNDERRRKEQHL